MPHFSKSFLAGIAPFDGARQTDANDYDEAAAFFATVERKVVGGFSGLLACHRSIVLTGNVPEGVRILPAIPTSEV